MSNITHEHMTNHIRDICQLKTKFMNTYKNNPEDAKKYIEEMRMIHGCSIYDEYSDLRDIDPKTANNNDWIKLSSNSSCLYLIHNYIRTCEKLMFKNKSGQNVSSLSVSESEIPKSFRLFSDTQRTAPTFSKRNTGTEELSLHPEKFKTEHVEFEKINLNPSDLFVRSDNLPYKHTSITKTITPERKKFSIITPPMHRTSSLTQSLGSTEAINRLTNTEAAKLINEYDQNITQMIGGSVGTASEMKSSLRDNFTRGHDHQHYDPKKTTVIYYWADWCGYSQRFQNEWINLQTMLRNEYPDIQFCNLNVKRDKELIKLAECIGVRGYPTIVLFHQGKIHHFIAGNKTAKDVMTFLKTCTNDFSLN